MTASSHATTTSGTDYAFFYRQPEMITKICANVITTYNFLQKHLLLVIMASSKRMLYKNIGDRSTSFVYNNYQLLFISARRVASLFTFNLCQTAVCLFLLKFYLLTFTYLLEIIIITIIMKKFI